MTSDPLYRMRLTLDVLDHLGLNLYSNIPAVVSEAVANSWDADAETVAIDLDTDSQTIVIRDDGSGMTREEVNHKYLTVGYRRRENEPVVTPIHGRHVMGRKGIGKLSLFSIAEEIEVHSSKLVDGDFEHSAFVMRTADVRDQMEAGAPEYIPEALEITEPSDEQGTRLELRQLKRTITSATAGWLRRRLARRFAVIGPGFNFRVLVDAEEIGVEDRDYFTKVEYLWSIGDVGDTYETLCANAKRAEHLSGVVHADRDFQIKGWVGTFDEQKSIEEENNTVCILAWGKLVQEDILGAIKQGGLFTKYLVGEIQADFLDHDERDDITTSDRQHLKEDDPRYEALKQFAAESILKPIGNRWRDWRRDDAVEKAKTNEVVAEWLGRLEGDSRSQAEKLFGRIGTLAVEDDGARRELYRYAILAFERLRYRDALSVIDQLPADIDFTALERVFAQVDELEAALFHQISRGRLEVIETFVDIATAEKEKVVQQYLFDHLWLLDPTWERVPSTARIEERIQTAFDKIDAGLTDEEKRGRVDLRYVTTAGKHVIIELKKYDVKVTTTGLIEQLKKYRSALTKCLSETEPDSVGQVELIAVLGSHPDDLDRQESAKMLDVIDARIVTYDELIANSQKAYKDYVDAHREITELNELLERL